MEGHPTKVAVRSCAFTIHSFQEGESVIGFVFRLLVQYYLWEQEIFFYFRFELECWVQNSESEVKASLGTGSGNKGWGWQ